MYIWLLLWACGASDPSETILAVGDSFLDFHADENASIPEVAAASLGYSVQNNALSGSMLTGPDGIPSQYEDGIWPWVVVSGGGNDANDLCGCETGCFAELLEEMVSPDLTSGVLTDLIDRSIDNGNKVVISMYMPITSEASDGFGQCVDALEEMTERYGALARAREPVLLVNSADIISPDTTPQAYEEDGVHPSVEGSAMIGEYIAEQIRAFGNE